MKRSYSLFYLIARTRIKGRTGDCCNSLGRASSWSERLTVSGDSWSTTKAIEVALLSQ